MRAVVIRAGWLAILVGWAIGQGALGQENPPSGLQPGEVLISLTFVMVSELKPQPPNDEGSRTTGSGGLLVEASFAAKYVAPSQGRRTLRDFRLLSADGIKGDLEESLNFIKPNKVGEGGVTPDPVIRNETWKALEVPLSLPEFDIEIDLVTQTWFAREFGDNPNKWFNELKKGQSYFGLAFDTDTPSGKPGLHPILLPRVPTLNYTTLGLAQSDFDKLGQPQPLQGTADLFSGGTPTKRLEGADSTGEWLLTWEIREAAPELELRVTAKGFADWRPSVKHYDPDGKVIHPGKPLSLTAQVTDPSGKIPAVHIKELRWTLHETSQLPGIAMNYPYQSTETSWDLSIAKRLPTQDKKQELVEMDLTTLKSSVNVWPWDHGGWSTLRVEATLDDGMKLQGKYKGPEGDETDIRLPDRTSDSKIHRKWSRTNQVNTEPDTADNDWEPEGKATALGDGFSNFEEYRGFYISKKVSPEKSKLEYVSTDPNVRNVFIYDRMKNDDSLAATQLFATASGAATYVVHPGEGVLDESRVMNVNRGSGPTQGAQHAIGIRKPAPTEDWRPRTTSGRPNGANLRVPPFEKFQTNAIKLNGRRDLYQRSITQALLVSCGVTRAGRGDREYTLSVKRGADGGPEVKTETGEVVTLRNESGHDEGEDWLREVEHADAVKRRLKSRAGNDQALAALNSFATRKYYVARQGGEHSGPIDNIMRDTFAEAYRVGNTIKLLPKGHQERVGYTLSVISTSNAEPNRYGDSPRPAPGKEFVPNDHR